MPSVLNQKVKYLPPVHEMIVEMEKDKNLSSQFGNEAMTWAVRRALEQARNMMLRPEDFGVDTEFLINNEYQKILNTPLDKLREELKHWVKKQVILLLHESGNSLRRVINATGVVLHTNCGRALLAPEAANYVAQQAQCYSNLELDIETGSRGSRYSHVEQVLLELTGAESALVVNNNAAAVLLIMNTLANHKEVIVSRGELVEVGGSFRIPEVLKAGGANLVEVGATNKTWLQDYKDAVSTETAMFLKVHTSNYRIEGFHHSVPVSELVQLGLQLNIPVIEDLGSGSFLDGSAYGLPNEPTIQEAIKVGVSLVTFSGDKLLGGPQAGIIVGKKTLIDKLKKNQLTRALRVDKMTLAALLGTLRYYQRNEAHKIPVWSMLGKNINELREEAKSLHELAKSFDTVHTDVQDNYSCVGGGAFPTAKMPTVVCRIQPITDSPLQLEKFLRMGTVPILTRIEKDHIVIDPRTLLPQDYEVIALRLKEWNEIQRNK